MKSYGDGKKKRKRKKMFKSHPLPRILEQEKNTLVEVNRVLSMTELWYQMAR